MGECGGAAAEVGDAVGLQGTADGGRISVTAVTKQDHWVEDLTDAGCAEGASPAGSLLNLGMHA